MHTQGGAHTRQSVATAGVLLFKWGVRGLAPPSSVASRSVGTVGAHYTPNATLFTRVPLPEGGGGANEAHGGGGGRGWRYRLPGPGGGGRGGTNEVNRGGGGWR